MNQEFFGAWRKSRQRKQKRRAGETSGRGRKILFEALEDRRVMAGLPFDVPEGEDITIPAATCNPKAAYTAFLPVGVNRQDFLNCSSTATSTTSGATAEGQPTAAVTLNEIEPNNVLANATLSTLGTAANKNPAVDIVGQLSSGDLDYYKVSLKAGDVFGASLRGATNLSFQDATGTELIGSQVDFGNIVYPTISPLPHGQANASLSYVIPTTGDYYLMVGGGTPGATTYRATTRVYRPTLEAGAVSQHQILFLDFNGAIIDTSVVGSTGIANLSPLRTFLPGWGLGNQNENEVIDAVVAAVQRRFDFLRDSLNANNGDFPSTFIPGQFDVEIRNSRDNPDPWGQTNVSRVIVGGTIAQLGIPTIGIAESLDVGNFDTTETAVVLLDLLSTVPTNANSINSIRLAAGASKIQLIGEVIGNVIAHEAGHFFGSFHTDNSNATVAIMDQGGVPISVLAGLGPDGFYGSADDVPIEFETDVYDPAELFTGIEDTRNTTAFGLATGLVPTQVTGTVWQDVNGNGNRDAGDVGLGGWTVFSDVNSDGLYQVGEPRAVTAADGSYRMYVIPGANKIAVQVQPNWVQTAPAAKTYQITIPQGQKFNNLDFGSTSLPNYVTGTKWQDVNGDGIRQSTDTGIAGFTIFVDFDNDGRLDIGEPAAVTDANGFYRITTTAVGTYLVREVKKNGYTQTSPANGAAQTVTLLGDTTVTGIDFGNAGPFIDFGDAPDNGILNYPTLLANDGARAYVVPGFHLGPATTLAVNPGPGVDSEPNGQQSLLADGDDTSGVDDEDGITMAPLAAGSNATLTAVVTVASGLSQGYLQGWIDFNGDGDWNDAGEQIIKDRSLANGTHQITFAVPANAVSGTTFARFRYGYEVGIGVTGLSTGGEVEDYLVRILTNTPQAANDTFTVNQNSTNNALNVLANDLPSNASPNLTIVSTSTPINRGTVTIDTRGTVNPNDDILRYSPLNGFVGVDTFTYTVSDGTGSATGTATATVTVNVLTILLNPIAVDDSVSVPSSSFGAQQTVSVLANDVVGINGPLRISSISVPSSNVATVTINPTSDALVLLVPAGSPAGDEQFTYTITDNSSPVPKTSTATVTVHFGSSNNNDLVAYSLQTFDLGGSQVDAVAVGQEFELRMYVRDIRTSDDFPNDGRDERGVFAAFVDLLYQSNLVTLTSAVNYSPTFSLVHEQVVTTPGIIDEVGGSQGNNNVVLSSAPVQVFSVRMLANQAGNALFRTDPADLHPYHDTLIYQATQVVPFDKISYGSKVLTIGDPILTLFRAVDDSINITNNAGNSTTNLPVLTNDFMGLNGPVTITSVSSIFSPTGSATGSVTIASGGQSLTYSPISTHSGTEQFSYTITNALGQTSTAVVTLNVGATSADDTVLVELIATDSNGNPITTVTPGATFQLRGYVQDLRTPTGATRGVAAAFLDVLYDYRKATAVKVPTSTNPQGFDITYGANFQQLPSGSANVPGLIDEVGAFQGTASNSFPPPLGSGKFELFRITFTASGSIGDNITFVPDPRDITPDHDVLLYEPPSAALLSQIRYTSGSVLIAAAVVGGEGERFTNTANPLDVNNDGYVSPLDALIGINFLNTMGTRKLVSGAGEGSSAAIPYFIDVNGDGFHTAIDVLMVINRLNSPGAGEGEGGFDSPLEDAVNSLAESNVSSKATSLSTSTAMLPLSGAACSELSTGTVRAGNAAFVPSLLASGFSASGNGTSPLVPNVLVSRTASSSFAADVASDSHSLDSLIENLAGDVGTAWHNEKQENGSSGALKLRY